MTHTHKIHVAHTSADQTPLLRQQLADAPAGAAVEIVFQNGRHEFHHDRATERFHFVANNDEGLKRIAISLVDRHDVVIDGQSATFRTHGAIVPIFLERCRNVTLKNFTLDAAVPFHAEATVLAVSEDSVDMELHEGYPYTLKHGRLRFPLPGSKPWEIHNILEFDPQKRETAFMVYDNYGIGDRMSVREIGPRRFRMTADFRRPLPTVGNVLALSGFGRYVPAIVVSDCVNVRLENITIHQAGGMGVIVQKTQDVTLHKVRVTPSGSRLISATADATHFVGCRGSVVMEDCLFENQLDDPTNVHGVYGKITGRPSPHTLEIKLIHEQQLGYNFASAGDKLELIRNTTLLTYYEAEVSRVERVNKEYTLLTFDRALPADIALGDAVGNLTWTPEVTIRRCTARGNRARGFLVTTPRKVLIEDNDIHTPGPAVLIAGDANYWFESGAVRDVTIRRNRFDNCNYGVWGPGVIEFHPEIEPKHRGTNCYHRNVTIEDNEFIVFDPRLVTGWGVENLVFRNNMVVPSTDYPAPVLKDESPFQLTHCVNAKLPDTRAAGQPRESPAALVS